MPDLSRFVEAQSDPFAGFDAALAELRSGRKRGHWIWYVFPQIRGLGHSPAAEFFAIANVDEATAFLRDPILGSRLLEAASVVLDQLHAGVRLETLFGSHLDALKLVSSMTLFEAAAAPIVTAGGDGVPAKTGETARAILEASAGQGFERCRHTLREVAR